MGADILLRRQSNFSDLAGDLAHCSLGPVSIWQIGNPIGNTEKKYHSINWDEEEQTVKPSVANLWCKKSDRPKDYEKCDASLILR
jgi:hypothetical protein